MRPLKLPEVIPCLIDVNPNKTQKAFETPENIKMKKPKKLHNSPRESKLRYNKEPGQLSNFK